MPSRRTPSLRIPCVLAVVASIAGCTSADATDASVDCAFTCRNEVFPSVDGGLVHVVIYADGAISDAATCDVPPPPNQCGV